MAKRTCDVVVIGGGPGGYVCSIRLGQLKQKVICVEKDEVGGVCLNWGCVPSKALIATSHTFEKVKNGATFGLMVDNPRIDVNKTQDWKDGKIDYNYTMQKFPGNEAPGASVFYKDPATGEIFHTYSTYGRGLDSFIGTYTLLDLVPKGRDEDQLSFDMQWVRYHDRYGTNLDTGFADKDKPYWPKIASTEARS